MRTFLLGMKMSLVLTEKPGYAKLSLSVRATVLAISLVLSKVSEQLYRGQFWSLAYACCFLFANEDVCLLEKCKYCVRLVCTLSYKHAKAATRH